MISFLSKSLMLVLQGTVFGGIWYVMLLWGFSDVVGSGLFLKTWSAGIGFAFTLDVMCQSIVIERKAPPHD